MDILIEESQGALWAVAVDGKNVIRGLEVDTHHEMVRHGDVYVAKVKTIDKARGAAFVDLGEGQTGMVYEKNVRKYRPDNGHVITGSDSGIGKVLSAGDLIIVQAKASYIVSDALEKDFESKIPEVSMDISLQGRHLVFCPFLAKNKISQRIGDKAMRGQLTDMLSDLGDDAKGVILRSSAAYQQTDIIMREAEILRKEWDALQDDAREAERMGDAPARLCLGIDAAQRLLSDLSGSDIDAIEVVTQEHMEHVQDWCSLFAPELMTKVRPVEVKGASNDLALLYARDVMEGVEDLLKSYAMLDGGGNLIIQSTAALTAIDVNKGNDNRGHLATNLSASLEALRQIRLRNIGGVIMLDLLNMKRKSDSDQCLKALREEASSDPCTVQIHGFTGTGMVEITRKRRLAPLKDRISL